MAKNGKNQITPQRTLGPISDLERHLPAEWWRNLFSSMYLKTDGDVVENNANTSAEIDFVLAKVGLEKNDYILDLCCGQGRHCLELARRGFTHINGVDRSRYLVRLGRQRARKLDLPVQFHEGDARSFNTRNQRYNCVMIMGNSFGYFERAEDDLAVLSTVRKALRSGGTIVLDITDGDWMKTHFESRSWEWIDQEHFVCRERSIAEDNQRLISREVIVHAERGVLVDQFYAERLYSEASIRELLERAGYENIRIHGAIKAQSDRGQDLGMMAHRIFLTANAPRQVITAPAKKRIRFPKVTVVMGDPGLPDSVKRDGQFNPEDMETINRLKRALEEIDGYEFTYLDNHGKLLTTLRQDPPEFVFNLCDEGFNNDAFLELHVPSYLEMLGIPYTGGGPACLGLCYNKSLVRAAAAVHDIPVPLETYFNVSDQMASLPSTFPALVKPNFGDSSIGITKNAVVYNSEQLIDYIDELKKTLPDRPLLIQEYLEGNEYSIGIIGNPGLTTTFLPTLMVDYSNLPEGLPKILGYESKWLPDSPYWTAIKYKEAKLKEVQLREIQDHSLKLFEVLGCRDYARIDWRMDSQGNLKLLEVNPNPGWCWDGKLNFMAEFAGLRYADMLRLIIEAGQERAALALPAPQPVA